MATQRSEPSVRRASAADAPGMARTLARAFAHDPVWTWFIPDELTRPQRLEVMFATLSREVYLRHGGPCHTTEGHTGAMLCAAPGRERLSVIDQVRVAPGWVRAIGWRGLLRARRGIHSFQAVHPAGRHYYVPFLGVAPEAQGGGLGPALMRPVLDACDRERTPAYLEATSALSRRCWERVGFDLVAEARVAPDGPPFWAMWREPAPA